MDDSVPCILSLRESSGAALCLCLRANRWSLTRCSGVGGRRSRSPFCRSAHASGTAKRMQPPGRTTRSHAFSAPIGSAMCSSTWNAISPSYELSATLLSTCASSTTSMCGTLLPLKQFLRRSASSFVKSAVCTTTLVLMWSGRCGVKRFGMRHGPISKIVSGCWRRSKMLANRLADHCARQDSCGLPSVALHRRWPRCGNAALVRLCRSRHRSSASSLLSLPPDEADRWSCSTSSTHVEGA